MSENGKNNELHPRKVGIITFHHVYNFGAFLQVWALTSVLKKLNLEVRVFNYCPEKTGRKQERRGIKAFIPPLGWLRFKRFAHLNLPLTPKLKTIDDLNEYCRHHSFHYYLCGSDQIWLKDETRGIYIDPAYYLNFGAKDVQRIAYAPSCGYINGYGEQSELVKRLIENISFLSVRDSQTEAILKKLGFQNVPKVVDPTLLADFSPIIRKPRIKKPYLMIAGPMNEAWDRGILCLARKLQLHVVAIGVRSGAADQTMSYVTPGEWISCLAHASYVVTSLFHGTVLAVKFRKPFIAITSGDRAFKIDAFLEQIHLRERLVLTTKGAELSDDLLSLDYSLAERKLNEIVQTSLDFLNKAFL